jgi:hypothetical protein
MYLLSATTNKFATAISTGYDRLGKIDVMTAVRYVLVVSNNQQICYYNFYQL